MAAELEAQPASDNRVKLSFTSKSKKVNSALSLRQQSVSNHRENDLETEQQVASHEHASQLLNDYQLEKQFIIPLIKHNQWRVTHTTPPPLESEQNGNTQPQTANIDTETDAELEKQRQEALQLILTDNNHEDTTPIILAPRNTTTATADGTAAIGAFNQMKLNQIPGIEEVVDPKKKMEIDCSLRPKEPDLMEYASVPIGSFGAAMLKGMGWQKEQPIGNQYGENQLKIPASAEVKRRPKNLGLGATLSKEEIELEIQSKFRKNKQHTDSDRKRIAEIQSFAEPPKKKQKTSAAEVEKEQSSGMKESRKRRIKWIRNGLRVRCIKRASKYFKEKGIVHDVIDAYRFVLCMDKDSKLVTLHEDEVETVIPKKGQFVTVLHGQHKNEKACILNKHKREQCATVQLQDDLSIVQCDYDDICAI